MKKIKNIIVKFNFIVLLFPLVNIIIIFLYFLYSLVTPFQIPYWGEIYFFATNHLIYYLAFWSDFCCIISLFLAPILITINLLLNIPINRRVLILYLVSIIVYYFLFLIEINGITFLKWMFN